MFTKLTLPRIVACLIVVLSTQPIYANFNFSKDSTPVVTPAKKWYDQISLRGYIVDETEIGIEWQPFKNFELVTMYTMSNRRFEDLKSKGNIQKGNLLRIQAQVNF